MQFGLGGGYLCTEMLRIFFKTTAGLAKCGNSFISRGIQCHVFMQMKTNPSGCMLKREKNAK